MWIIKMVLQAFALFAVPLLILTVYNGIVGIGKAKATGLAVLQAYGPFFILTGLFYVALGVFLWSPLPERLLRQMMSKHNLG